MVSQSTLIGKAFIRYVNFLCLLTMYIPNQNKESPHKKFRNDANMFFFLCPPICLHNFWMTLSDYHYLRSSLYLLLTSSRIQDIMPLEAGSYYYQQGSTLNLAGIFSDLVFFEAYILINQKNSKLSLRENFRELIEIGTWVMKKKLYLRIYCIL